MPAEIEEIARRYQLRSDRPPAVMQEVQKILAAPGIEDPKLIDLTHLPFITIDNPDSKDLDQAMFMARRPSGGYEVYYALADAAHYVRPGTALWADAMARGTSFYVPGAKTPMLPRELSEGIVSLNPGVDRRALVVKMTLDPYGQPVQTDLLRARVRSRQKLTFAGVSEYHTHKKGHALAGKPFTETLDLLREVGEQRQARARERDVVNYDRINTEVTLDLGGRLVATVETRTPADKWNEQISLLCNHEAAKFLEERSDLGVYKVHPAPQSERLREFDKNLDRLVGALGIDPRAWAWRADGQDAESLAEFIARLPDAGAEKRLAMAIQRQAVLLNEAAFFSKKPGRHDGVGAEPYARASAPMREIAGIVTHHLLIAALERREPDVTTAMVDEAIAAAEAAKKKGRDMDRELVHLARDNIFTGDYSLPEEQRPARLGTVLGVGKEKLYVQLDDPPLEVKVGLADIEKHLGYRAVALAGGFELARDDGRPLARIGDPISVVVMGRDPEGRWQLVPIFS